MPSMTTFLLGVAALAAVIYAIGVDTTRNAVTTAGSKTKRAATTSTGAALGGIGFGAQLGYEVIQAGMMEPFAVTTIIAGITGFLGIEGMLGGLSGVQYLLIGVAIFAVVAVLGGDD